MRTPLHRRAGAIDADDHCPDPCAPKSAKAIRRFSEWIATHSPGRTPTCAAQPARALSSAYSRHVIRASGRTSVRSASACGRAALALRSSAGISVLLSRSTAVPNARVCLDYAACDWTRQVRQRRVPAESAPKCGARCPDLRMSCPEMSYAQLLVHFQMNRAMSSVSSRFFPRRFVRSSQLGC